MKKLLTLITLSTLLWGCGGRQVDLSDLDDEDTNSNEHQTQNAEIEESVVHVNPAEINLIINSIPSPLEVAFLIKETGGEYNSTFLNATDKIDNYDNSHSKALNLGIYGADLAYTNIYSQHTDGANFLGAVKGLAEDLNIDKYFDINTIQRLLKHNENLDSLLLITTSNFEKINVYMQENKRSHLSTLLLTGGWIEGLHLICEVYAYHPSDELRDKIGEQKVVLDQLMMLLRYYEKDPKINPIIKSLEELEKVYSEITIETVEGETTFEEIDGIMMAVDNSQTKINITAEQVNEISRLNTKIREEIIK